jgi:hypothetical protein
MKLKNNVEIIDITHEDLVNLFSTALYGSSYLSAEYDKDFYNSIPKDKKEGDCFEDHIADVLLNGGEIYIYDAYSEGEVYSKNGELIKEEYGDEEYAQYTLTLTDIIEGLERAANGTYKTNDDTKFIRQCFNEFAEDDCYDLDLTDADALMQVITFNELIYG